jgi:hypothetical protein
MKSSFRKLKSLKNELPELKTVILLEGNSSENWVINFDEFLKSGKEPESEFEIGMNELCYNYVHIGHNRRTQRNNVLTDEYRLQKILPWHGNS